MVGRAWAVERAARRGGSGRPVLRGRAASLARGGGLAVSGWILVGVAGSLGTMIGESGVADVLKSLLTATAVSPLLLAWLVARCSAQRRAATSPA